MEWWRWGRFSPSRATEAPQVSASFRTSFWSCRKCRFEPIGAPFLLPLGGSQVTPFSRPLLLTCQPTNHKWTLVIPLRAHTHTRTHEQRNLHRTFVRSSGIVTSQLWSGGSSRNYGNHSTPCIKPSQTLFSALFIQEKKKQDKVLNKEKWVNIWPFVFPAVPWLYFDSIVAAVIQRDVMKGNLVVIWSWHEMLTPAKKGSAGNGRMKHTRRSLHFYSNVPE